MSMPHRDAKATTAIAAVADFFPSVSGAGIASG
jgi:hypothetical protein